MASDQVCLFSRLLLLLLTILPGALCEDNYSVGGLVAAGGAAFIFLAIVIAMIVIGFTWNSWYPALQRAKGRVKMPRSYWKKKEEARHRLIHGSTRSGLASIAAPSENGLPNGHPAGRVLDTEENKSDRASWVQGWNNANPTEDGAYEEMALEMDLGEEKDEFRIETTVVDNETLDLGPFKDTPGTSQQTATMEMTEEEPEDRYVYSTVDRSSKKSTSGGVTSNDPEQMTEAVTSFSKLDPELVAL